MKKKLWKVLPRLLALFLILTIVLTPNVVQVLAVNENNMETAGSVKDTTGGGQTANGANPDGTQTIVGAKVSNLPKDPNCDGYSIQGVMIRLISFDNEAKNGDYEEYQKYIAEYNQSLDVKSKISECQMSAIDKYLYTYPAEFISNPNVVNECALIFQRGDKPYGMSTINSHGKPVAYKTGDGYVSTEYFKNVYDVKLGSGPSYTWFPAHLAYEQLAHNEAYRTAFFNGELTYDAVKAIVDTSNVDLAKKNILALFENTSRIGDLLGGIWTNAQNAKDELGRPIEDVYRLFYLDMLLAIDYLCGEGTFRSEIDTYLKYLNKNGADRFTIPIMANVMIFRKTGGDGVAWASTLPDYYGWISGKGANTFATMETLGGKTKSYLQKKDDGREDLKTHYDSQTQNWWGKYEDLLPTKAPVGKEEWYRRRLWWTSIAGDANASQENWANAFGLLPTDCFGRATGNIGYTYLALGGGSGTEPALPFKLTAQSSQTEVEPGSKVAATINIDLKQTNTNAVQNAFTENGEKAMLTIQYGVQAVEGSGATSVIDNIQTAPSGASKSGNVLTVNNITLADITPYIKGSKLIQINDKDITISQKTTNKYTAVVTLSWPNGKKLQFEASGKTIESQYQASDKVSWSAAKDDPNTWHFYSSIGKNNVGLNNYVEIKEGSPGNESFEAMAGGPTTENLYVGFGATEFMMNMDVKLDTSKGVRNYYYKYNAANCIGNDQPCVYSCPGHINDTYKNGCGKLLCTNTSPLHNHSDSCYCKSGSAPTGSCSTGEIKLVSRCGCGDKESEKIFTPTWGAGYSECLGGDGSKDYTGMGCVHTEHTNSTHKGVLFQGCIQQPIASFNYMNITALDLWRVNKLELKGNSKLLSNPNQSWDPDTGYYAFFNQNGYSSGNGRLVFITNLAKQDINNRHIWGDTTYECPNPSTGYITWDAACSLASQWMNECAANTQVSAVVVSDYLSLCTTEGYQTPAFHTYDSDIVQLTNESFNTVGFVDNIHGISLSPIKGNEITFSSVIHVN